MKTVSFNTDWTCNGAPVTLPHDAQITETRGPETSNGGHAYFPGGIYTYEKTFTAPAEWEGKTVLAEFECVYKNATVSLNGKELCFHPYGYTGFFVELEGLKIGGRTRSPWWRITQSCPTPAGTQAPASTAPCGSTCARRTVCVRRV